MTDPRGITFETPARPSHLQLSLIWFSLDVVLTGYNEDSWGRERFQGAESARLMLDNRAYVDYFGKVELLDAESDRAIPFLDGYWLPP